MAQTNAAVFTVAVQAKLFDYNCHPGILNFGLHVLLLRLV